MTKKLIASIALLAFLGVFVAGCGSQSGGSSSVTNTPKAPTGKAKVDASGQAGKGGAIPDLEVDH